jgi:hypothetical protein
MVLKGILFMLQASGRHAYVVVEYSQRTMTQLAILLQELWIQLPSLLGESKYLQEVFTP